MARKGDRLLPQKFGAGLARGFFVGGALRPVINHYVHPEVTGLADLADLEPPLILAANHSSHMDTPLILNSLPKELRDPFVRDAIPAFRRARSQVFLCP